MVIDANQGINLRWLIAPFTFITGLMEDMVGNKLSPRAELIIPLPSPTTWIREITFHPQINPNSKLTSVPKCCVNIVTNLRTLSCHILQAQIDEQIYLKIGQNVMNPFFF